MVVVLGVEAVIEAEAKTLVSSLMCASLRLCAAMYCMRSHPLREPSAGSVAEKGLRVDDKGWRGSSYLPGFPCPVENRSGAEAKGDESDRQGGAGKREKRAGPGADDGNGYPIRPAGWKQRLSKRCFRMRWTVGGTPAQLLNRCLVCRRPLLSTRLRSWPVPVIHRLV
jgi:hypothetical protein